MKKWLIDFTIYSSIAASKQNWLYHIARFWQLKKYASYTNNDNMLKIWKISIACICLIDKFDMGIEILRAVFFYL